MIFMSSSINLKVHFSVTVIAASVKPRIVIVVRSLVNYWQKNILLVQVNCLGDLLRNTVVTVG